MALESRDLHHLTAATGYVELGMFLDAEMELDAISLEARPLPEVLAVRMEIYSRQQAWARMQGLAERLMRNDPGNSAWVVSYAYATRRAASLEAAKAVLLAAIQQHPEEPIIPYNLACYECQLGNLESGKRYLEVAVRMFPGFRAAALKDPDLEPLWGRLAD